MSQSTSQSVNVLVNGSFVYRRGYLFNIPQLNFQAQLELHSRGLTPDKYSSDRENSSGNEEARLRTELRYSVGMLKVDLVALVARQRGHLNKSIRLQLNRKVNQF